jgi:hypothetical protein
MREAKTTDLPADGQTVAAKRGPGVPQTWK